VFIDAINRLYTYQRESNRHLLVIGGELPVAQLTEIVVDGQPSIRDTTVHMIEVIESHVA